MAPNTPASVDCHEREWFGKISQWRNEQLRGDREADVQDVDRRVRAQCEGRLKSHLRFGRTDSARALAQAAGITCTPMQIEYARRLHMSRSEVGHARAPIWEHLGSLCAADIDRERCGRAIGAWAEYPHVRELRARLHVGLDINRWRRGAWAAIVEPGVLADHGTGPRDHPHRMLPVSERFLDEWTGAHRESPCWAGWRAAVDDGGGSDARGWLLGAIAGTVGESPMAISAAFDLGAITRDGHGEMAREARVRAQGMGVGPVIGNGPDDVLRCRAEEGWVSLLPHPMPGSDLLSEFTRCAHPHPHWETSPRGDMLFLSCAHCMASALAAVPIHHVTGYDFDPERQLSFERAHAILSGAEPPQSLTHRPPGGPVTDIETLLGRPVAAGTSLSDALFE